VPAKGIGGPLNPLVTRQAGSDGGHQSAQSGRTVANGTGAAGHKKGQRNCGGEEPDAGASPLKTKFVLSSLLGETAQKPKKRPRSARREADKRGRAEGQSPKIFTETV